MLLSFFFLPFFFLGIFVTAICAFLRFHPTIWYTFKLKYVLSMTSVCQIHFQQLFSSHITIRNGCFFSVILVLFFYVLFLFLGPCTYFDMNFVLVFFDFGCICVWEWKKLFLFWRQHFLLRTKQPKWTGDWFNDIWLLWLFLSSVEIVCGFLLFFFFKLNELFAFFVCLIWGEREAEEKKRNS